MCAGCSAIGLSNRTGQAKQCCPLAQLPTQFFKDIGSSKRGTGADALDPKEGQLFQHHEPLYD